MTTLNPATCPRAWDSNSPAGSSNAMQLALLACIGAVLYSRPSRGELALLLIAALAWLAAELLLRWELRAEPLRPPACECEHLVGDRCCCGGPLGSGGNP